MKRSPSTTSSSSVVAILADPAKGGRGRPGLIWADDTSGRRRNLNFEEDKAFWGWALIEVLRHTGVRIEELTELTHRSFVAYTLPSTGEVIPLLQVTPSKTDKERLLVVSPELGEVLTRSSPGSAADTSSSRWCRATTTPNDSTAHRCRSCSNASTA